MKNNLRSHAVINALINRTFAIGPESGFKKITENRADAFHITIIEKFVHQIINSERNIFSIIKNEDGIFIVYCKNTIFLENLYEHFDSKIGELLTISFPNHKFNPYIDLFIEVSEQLMSKIHYNIFHYHSESKSDFCYGSSVMHEYDIVLNTVNMLNKFIDIIKDESNSKIFKKKLANYRSDIINNNKELVKYIDNLFTKHSSLLVLKIDFGYKDIPYNQDEINTNYKNAREDRNNFINSNYNGIFDHRVGYALKMGYYPLKGYFYEMFFFFDGKIVKPDNNRVMMIGEHWKTITNGKGLYLDCNSKKHYPWLNIINQDDHELRLELENAAGNLINPDYYAKLCVNRKHKYFVKGVMPKTN